MLRKGPPGSKQACRTDVQTSTTCRTAGKTSPRLHDVPELPSRHSPPKRFYGNEDPFPTSLPPPSVTAYRLGKRKARQDNIYDAPFAVIVCACRSKAWTRENGMNTAAIDAAILTDHMMLEAASLGLRSVWICWFKADILKRKFALPEGLVSPLSVGSRIFGSRACRSGSA